MCDDSSPIFSEQDVMNIVTECEELFEDDLDLLSKEDLKNVLGTQAASERYSRTVMEESEYFDY